MFIHSPTGPGFISISPLISSSRTTTAPTTILPRPEGTLKPGLKETRRTLAWEEECDKHQMFDFTISFWRAMAGSMLFRDGSMRGACLQGVWCGWIHHWSTGFMWAVVASCTCSAVTTNIGSMKIHMVRRKAWAGATWPSWHWNRGLMHWGCDLWEALIMLAWLSGAQHWLELGKRRRSKWIILEKRVQHTHCCTAKMVSWGAFKGSLWQDATVQANSKINSSVVKCALNHAVLRLS